MLPYKAFLFRLSEFTRFLFYGSWLLFYLDILLLQAFYYHLDSYYTVLIVYSIY